MRLIGNLIWLLFGGLVVSIEYLIATIILAITIIGFPFALQTFKMAEVALWPFNKDFKPAPRSSGCLSVLFNLIWLLFGGIWISLTHLLFGILLAITIIGFPFAVQHFKLAALALAPFGREIYNKH